MSTKDICSNRHGGNPESREAYKHVKPFLTAQEAEVIAVYRGYPEGLTAEEVEETLGLHRSSVTARISSLKARGILKRKYTGTSLASGKPIYDRRSTRSGASAAVLVLNPETLANV